MSKEEGESTLERKVLGQSPSFSSLFPPLLFVLKRSPFFFSSPFLLPFPLLSFALTLSLLGRHDHDHRVSPSIVPSQAGKALGYGTEDHIHLHPFFFPSFFPPPFFPPLYQFSLLAPVGPSCDAFDLGGTLVRMDLAGTASEGRGHLFLSLLFPFLSPLLSRSD